MIVELLRVKCGCGNQLTGLFDNHHQAIVAGERAGWLMQSESIGGDQCPRCLKPWDINNNGVIDDADELAAYAEASDLRALAEREAGSQPVPTPNQCYHMVYGIEGSCEICEAARANALAEREAVTEGGDDE